MKIPAAMIAGRRGMKIPAMVSRADFSGLCLRGAFDGGLIGLPVVGDRLILGDAVLLGEDVHESVGFAGADHHLQGFGIDDAHDAFGFFQGIQVGLFFVFQAQPQPGHTVGDCQDIVLAANQFENLACQFFVGH